MRRGDPDGPARVVLGVLVLLLALGLGMALHFDDHFLPSRQVPTPGIGFLGLLPVSLAAIVEMDAAEPLSKRYPTAWVRAIVWPLFVGLLAGLLYLSLLGWIAAASHAMADGVQHQMAEVRTLGRHEGIRGQHCQHSMTITYSAGTATLCADGMPGVDAVRAGGKVLLAGPSSALGQHVTELRRP